MKWGILSVSIIASLLENFGFLALIYVFIRW